MGSMNSPAPSGLPDWVLIVCAVLAGLLILSIIAFIIVKTISKWHEMKGPGPQPVEKKEKKAKKEKPPKESRKKKETAEPFSGLAKHLGTDESVPIVSEPSEKSVKPGKTEKILPAVSDEAAPILESSAPEGEVDDVSVSMLHPPVKNDRTDKSRPMDAPAASTSNVLNVPNAPKDSVSASEKAIHASNETKSARPAENLSDEALSDTVDVLSKERGIPLLGKKGAKKGKSKKVSPRKSAKQLKKKSKRLRIPKTVQETIPYYRIYPDNGIIETEPGVFTKSYLLQDINYQIAKEDEQFDMFMKYGQLLNGFDPTLRFEITINQKNINMEEFEERTMLPMREDGLDDLRRERNEMLKKKIMEGKNSLVKEKYLTVSAQADSLSSAELLFTRLDAEITANVKKIGHADATVLPTARRLEILHDIYNIGSEGCFGNNLVKVEREDGKLEYAFADEKFRFDIMHRMGLTTKDMIGPASFTFKSDHGKVGSTYFRALFLRKIPTYLCDNVLAELTNTDCNMITSIHYQAIDGEKAQKMVRNKMTNINAGMVDKQKKASKAGYSVDLISPELQDAARETSQLMEDINSKNQKLFFATLVIVHFADTKEQLDSDTKSIQTIGRRLQCDIKKLSEQQENGLNTVLPLAYNQLHIKRSLTTESAAVLMPFVNQELNDRNGGMYYGNNAVSHNLIMLNRRNAKNGNGFIFGTPGSGKSMSAKQEMLTVLLSSDDTVLVIDPEGEYYPMAEMLGGEVIRIAAGADVHINPFDIDMDSDSEDDPMAIKSDFIVSLCETAVAGQYGLAPTQRSIIDRCVRKAYEPYLASRNEETGRYDKNKLPTLKDFYTLLRQQSGYDAMQLADGLEIYVTGSLNIFAHRTNVEYHKRFVVFDIKDVGATMKPMAMLVVLDNIWNRIVAGRKECRYTWFFADEIYLLFKTQSSAEFLRNLYKRARKYYGLPTGITQNVDDLLKDDTARTMISNCEYIQMLNQAPLDRVQLAELLNISETQLGFVTNSSPGEGLIYDGRVIVPFVNKLPKDTKMYEAMTTKPDEVRAREERRKAAAEKGTSEKEAITSAKSGK